LKNIVLNSQAGSIPRPINLFKIDPLYVGMLHLKKKIPAFFEMAE